MAYRHPGYYEVEELRDEEACALLERAIGKLDVVDTAVFGYASNGGNPAELSWVLQEVIGDLRKILDHVRGANPDATILNSKVRETPYLYVVG